MPPQTTRPTPVKLDASELLAAEYNYIAQTAHQANEDRARVLSFYLVTVGSLIGAIVSAQLDASLGIYLAFAGLFAILAAFGLLTLLQLIQLRKAWTESAIAMDQIKKFMLQKYPTLKPAIRWRMDKIPVAKPSSVSYLQAVQVAILSSVALGCVLHFVLLAVERYSPLAAVVCGLLALAGQIEYFHRKFQYSMPKP